MINKPFVLYSRIFTILIFTTTCINQLFAQDNISLLNELKVEISKKDYYDSKKELRIEKWKRLLAKCSKYDYKNQYYCCSQLYDEYRSYQFDSAYVYTQKLINISALTKNETYLYKSQLRLGFILVSSGMFKETFDCLHSIKSGYLDSMAKLEYYELKYFVYTSLANYNNDEFYSKEYRRQAIAYIDSAIKYTKPNTFKRILHLGDLPNSSNPNIPPSYRNYEILYYRHKLTAYQKAIIATSLSNFYQGDKRLKFLIIGAINDIRSSTKETQATYRLGMELSKLGRTNDAYIFLQAAINNAQFYGSKNHKVKLASILPIIAAQKIALVEIEKRNYILYFILILFSLIVITLVSYAIFIQHKKLRSKDLIIIDNNNNLVKLNDKLIEDITIKEQYLGQFFDVISDNIVKLETLKSSLEKKIKNQENSECLDLLKEVNIKREREKLFASFDSIFIKLFPNFISEFNALLEDDGKIWPKKKEILNTTLRIFALMRLGINNPERVSKILQRSTNTIYTYKFRIKSKAIVSSEEFNHRIMAIKVVNS